MSQWSLSSSLWSLIFIMITTIFTMITIISIMITIISIMITNTQSEPQTWVPPYSWWGSSGPSSIRRTCLPGVFSCSCCSWWCSIMLLFWGLLRDPENYLRTSQWGGLCWNWCYWNWRNAILAWENSACLFSAWTRVRRPTSWITSTSTACTVRLINRPIKMGTDYLYEDRHRLYEEKISVFIAPLLSNNRNLCAINRNADQLTNNYFSVHRTPALEHWRRVTREDWQLHRTGEPLLVASLNMKDIATS